MPTTTSHSPSRIPMIREKDILVLRDILEGKLAGRRPRSCVDGQTITARFICSPHNLLWASGAALHVLQVHVAVISLQGSIARRMAVLASRRSQYAIKLQKRCARCGGI